MEKINVIKFSYNWNNKICCKCFTTLRIEDNQKYIIGNKYKITLKEKYIKSVEIIDIRCFKINNIGDYIGYLDTGYSGVETIAIIKKMYPKVDFSIISLYFILMKTIE